MRRSYGNRAVKAPCPGCGETGKRRIAAEVCDDCKAVRTQLVKLQAMYAELLARDKTRRFVSVPSLARRGDLPYVPNAPDNRDAMQLALCQLAFAIGVPVTYKAEDSYYSSMALEGIERTDVEALIELSNGHDPVIISAPAAAIAAFRALYLAIEAMAQEAYKTGHFEGRNLLMNLHRGEITTRELDEAIGMAEKKRARRRS